MPEPVPVFKPLPLTVAFQEVHAVHFQRTLTLRGIHVANVSAVAVKARVCACPKGVTPQASNALVWDFSIPSNDFVEFGEGFRIEPGGSLQASAEADNSLVIHFSGDET